VGVAPDPGGMANERRGLTGVRLGYSGLETHRQPRCLHEPKDGPEIGGFASPPRDGFALNWWLVKLSQIGLDRCRYRQTCRALAAYWKPFKRKREKLERVDRI